MPRFEIEAPDPKRFPDGKPMLVCPVRFSRFRGEKAFTTDRTTNVQKGRPPVVEFGLMQPGAPTAHSAAVCFRVEAGDPNELTVQVVRDRVGTDAKLFPVVVDPTVATLVVPAPGSYIPVDTVTMAGLTMPLNRSYIMDDDKVTLRALPGNARTTLLQLHHGAVDGPVIAEMTVVVLPVIRIPVKIHDVTINGPSQNGTSPASDPARMKALFADINVVFEQIGIEIFFAEETGGLPKINAVSNTVNQSRYVAADKLSNFGEVLDVLTLGNGQDVLNAYVIRQFAGSVSTLVGFGMPRSRAATLRATPVPPGSPPPPAVQPGLVLLAEGSASSATPADVLAVARTLLVHTLAHEIGHALELTHFAGGEQNTHNVRHDFEAHTNLMHNSANLSTSGVTPPGNDPNLYNSAMRAEIGYAQSTFTPPGSTAAQVMRHAGQALSLAQMVVSRVAALVGTYKQF